MVKVYTCFQTKTAQTLPDGAAHTYAQKESAPPCPPRCSTTIYASSVSLYKERDVNLIRWIKLLPLRKNTARMITREVITSASFPAIFFNMACSSELGG